MSNNKMIWLDDQRCCGCGECVEACPIGAIMVINNKAHIEDGRCTGCGACIDACPEKAIQFVVEGEFVPLEEHALPAVCQTVAVAEAAKSAAAARSTAVLGQTTRTVVQQAGRWLVQAAKEGASALGQAMHDQVSAPSKPQPRGGSGARHRERQRRGRH